jgi:hypothetical protein
MDEGAGESSLAPLLLSVDLRLCADLISKRAPFNRSENLSSVVGQAEHRGGIKLIADFFMI